MNPPVIHPWHQRPHLILALFVAVLTVLTSILVLYKHQVRTERERRIDAMTEHYAAEIRQQLRAVDDQQDAAARTAASQAPAIPPEH